MSIQKEQYKNIIKELSAKGVTLVAVSKKKPAVDIMELYRLGHRDFGENYVQELEEKQAALPADIRWHFIGHLQSNKVKYIAPFVHLIHAVDSFGLLQEINKQAHKNNRTIDVMLQVYIAKEETKFGLDEQELTTLLEEYTANIQSMANIRICGLMGMATNTNDEQVIRKEFAWLHQLLLRIKSQYFADRPYFETLSMGMSADYELAIEEGSTMVRIGSLIFGAR